jgi:hypothetical protein
MTHAGGLSAGPTTDRGRAVKYRVVKGCAWNTFQLYGVEGTTVDAADMKTADGKALPAEVVDLFVRKGNLEPVADDDPPPTPEQP